MQHLPSESRGKPEQTSTPALVGFILSIMAMPLTFFPFPVVLGLPLSIAGLITSFIGRRQIQVSGDNLRGKRLAIAGITISAVCLVVCAFLLLILVSALALTRESTFLYKETIQPNAGSGH